LLCTDLVSVRYLTGFTGSSAMLLVDAERAVIVTDGRYQTQVAEQLSAAGVDAAVEITRAPLDVLPSYLTPSLRVGLEADSISWAASQTYGESLDVELVATSGMVASLRAIKDAGEIARLAAAAGIADAALANLRDRFVPGTVERDFAQALDSEMVRLGADGRSFETIVASGPNGAKPHARPTPKPFADGELVIVDFGALVDGYHSDMTRTFAVGALSDTQHRMVEVVTAAQAAGVATVGPGVQAAAVDAACRDHIDAAGWADAFLHGTGHGIGLVIHEEPRVAKDAVGVLAAGHCVTVEPGVYLTEHGGVRVEDSVVVTDDGCRPLTKFPKD
jgi:Xaa-Pro aminopeptidase